MDTLTRVPAADISSPSQRDDFLPSEKPMAMSAQALRDFPQQRRIERAGATPVGLRRAYIFVGTAALTLGGCYEMYDVLKVGGVTVLEAMVLGLFVLLFAWIA